MVLKANASKYRWNNYMNSMPNWVKFTKTHNPLRMGFVKKLKKGDKIKIATFYDDTEKWYHCTFTFDRIEKSNDRYNKFIIYGSGKHLDGSMSFNKQNEFRSVGTAEWSPWYLVSTVVNKAPIKKKRPSPSKSATEFNKGIKRKGGDGNIWVVIIDKNKRKRWKRIT